MNLCEVYLISTFTRLWSVLAAAFITVRIALAILPFFPITIPKDMGMVIGKNGKIAKAIRTVMKAAASTDNRRVNVEIR